MKSFPPLLAAFCHPYASLQQCFHMVLVYPWICDCAHLQGEMAGEARRSHGRWALHSAALLITRPNGQELMRIMKLEAANSNDEVTKKL